MFIQNLQRRLFQIAAILLSTFLYCTLALYNGFPFTFNNDSAVYLERGVTGAVRSDRPITYGLFVVVSSMHYSLWLVAILQALIVSLLVYFVFSYSNKYFYTKNDQRFLFYYLGFTGFVCLFTGASCEVTMLMPDVFTAVAILCIALLIIFKLKIIDLIIISAILVLSIIVHNSHFFICILLCCLMLAGYILRRIRLLYNNAGIRLKTILFVIVLSIFSTLLSAGIHKHYGPRFKSSFGGAIFLMSNLIEMGVVDSYLDENCDKKNYRLCRYKDSIPNNFLWAQNSPLKKTGGWGKANDSVFLAIEKDLLTTPKHLSRVIYKSGIYTIKQFFNYDMEHVTKPTTFVNNTIRAYFNDDYDSYINSRQPNEDLRFGFINFSQNLVVGISCFIYCLIGLYAKRSRKLLMFTFFILAALIINAWFCSTFSGVYSRYQTRVVWLLPLPLFVCAIKYFNLEYFKNIHT
jgi:hypothetical protein